jgi:hypothetical protein
MDLLIIDLFWVYIFPIIALVIITGLFNDDFILIPIIIAVLRAAPSLDACLVAVGDNVGCALRPFSDHCPSDSLEAYFWCRHLGPPSYKVQKLSSSHIVHIRFDDYRVDNCGEQRYRRLNAA